MSPGDAEARPLLVAQRVTKSFEGLVANRDIDFNIPRHSIVSIIGPNGAGKTTFFNQITGVYPRPRGTIELRRNGISGLPPHAIAEPGHRAHLPEHPPLPEHDRARQRAWSAATCGCSGQWYGAIAPAPPASGARRSATARARPELLELRRARAARGDELAKNLPYGDQRRLEIARALASDPKLLLLDEPAAGMNPGETAPDDRLHRAGCAASCGLTILLIEHDMRVVMGV